MCYNPEFPGLLVTLLLITILRYSMFNGRLFKIGNKRILYLYYEIKNIAVIKLLQSIF